MKLGQMIVKIRKEKDISQEEFARMFNVTRQTVSNWEREKSYPDLLTIIAISDMSGYTIDSLLKEDPEMTKKMNNDIERGRSNRKEGLFGIVISSTAIFLSISCCVLNIGKNAYVAIFWALITLLNYSTLVYHTRWFLKNRKRTTGEE